MVRFLLKVVLLAFTFFLLAYGGWPAGLEVVPDPQGALGEPGTYLWIGLIFGVVNGLVRPVVTFFSLPFLLLTLGLFLLLINAAMLGLVALLTDRLQVDGFVTAVVAGTVLALVGWLVDAVLGKD